MAAGCGIGEAGDDCGRGINPVGRRNKGSGSVGSAGKATSLEPACGETSQESSNRDTPRGLRRRRRPPNEARRSHAWRPLAAAGPLPGGCSSELCAAAEHDPGRCGVVPDPLAHVSLDGRRVTSRSEYDCGARTLSSRVRDRLPAREHEAELGYREEKHEDDRQDDHRLDHRHARAPAASPTSTSRHAHGNPQSWNPDAPSPMATA